ncbi:MAG: glycosyltransferase family 2 protein [Rhodocyclales bacterium]|nr:glycosyltransferase family 2 protein [Rhodocyclales bacterium]
MSAGADDLRDHVVVVVVNFNGLHDTIECLQSLAMHCDPRQFSVVLIDNASSAPIDELRALTFPFELDVRTNAFNEGFAAACNTGIRGAVANRSRYVLLLNNDTVVVDDVISALKGVLDADACLGIVGAVNYYHSLPAEVWCAGVRADFAADRFDSVKSFDRTGNKAVRVDWVPGSSLMARTELLQEIGLLDEKYFVYWEEVDLCLRARRNGSEVAFAEGTRILHKVGRSSPNALKEYLRTRNKLYFYRKNLVIAQFFRASLRVVAKALLRSIYNVMVFRPRLAVAYLVGIVDFLQGRMGSQRVEFFLKR